LPDGVPQPADIHTVIFDFDGVFTDNHVLVDGDGREWVRCSRADGLGIDMLRDAIERGELTAEVFILSTEANPVVSARAGKLRLDCYQGVDDKLGFVADRLKSRFPNVADPLQGVVFLGNDVNDLPLLNQVGWSIAPSDAHPDVRSVVGEVFEERGGEAFVRRFVERMLGKGRGTEDEVDGSISDC
tara:strand:- start:866 stop:1423 length:558 start_codon:yes stop_codon:yes gene_type:complete